MRNRLKTKMIKILSGNRVTRLTVQVADTPQKRDKGLMFVGKLPENEGMLFVFSERTYGGFWMKNIYSFIDCISRFKWGNFKNT
jgi:uncharacterized protein